MIEIISLIFGGVSRLSQHWMVLRDKDKECSHEADLLVLALRASRFTADLTQAANFERHPDRTSFTGVLKAATPL